MCKRRPLFYDINVIDVTGGHQNGQESLIFLSLVYSVSSLDDPRCFVDVLNLSQSAVCNVNIMANINSD